MTHRIVILGAGYAGLGMASLAARLLRRSDVQLTLVNRTDEFVERVRLHQLAAGQDLRRWPLADVLAGTGVDLVVAEVIGIDLESKTVLLDNGTINYDTLVYALGSTADVDTVPGVREHAFTVAAPEQALRLREHVATMPAGQVIAVIGGGLTGIEAAAELAEARPDLRVEIVSDSPVGGWLSQRAQRYLREALARKEIALREGSRISKVGPAGVLLENGGQLSADAVVWAAGFRVPRLAAVAGLATDEHGRMRVDDQLQSVCNPDVYAVGDVAAAPTPGGTETRMSCQTALPMGRYVAKEIACVLHGRESKPIRIRYVWQNISLGRRDGVTQFTRSDDHPTAAVLTGRFSAWFKEFITRGAAWRTRP